ncbi:Bromodomain-containing protein [Spironucleus salmonicida]|uniref:Bromodomain-containing protein n=1 Tax=Spironucleus salmonicida TaxID=348837 RepID=V6LLX4_9EUKA|nr:Bromodomain-containing protein [Spironucleus salmonicida]|eukprot:EST45213.1 Bromodomain-containing protein [Spironucleus salmonicida]
MSTPYSLAATILTQPLQNQLAKLVDQQKKQKPYGEVFSKPVDAIALGIPDYPIIVQKPMDYSTLYKNLTAKIYQTLSSFILDASLIFANCKKYNGDAENGWYQNISDQAEAGFTVALSKIFADLTTENYNLIILLGDIGDINSQIDESQQPQIGDIQSLVRKMSELSQVNLGEIIQIYCNAKGLEISKNGDVSVDLQLRTIDGDLIWQMLRACDAKLDEQKKAKKKGRK